MWCAANGGEKLGPFYDMVNSELYMNSILEPLFQMFTEGEKQYEHFQQDHARAQASQQSVVVLREIFGEQIMGVSFARFLHVRFLHSET